MTPFFINSNICSEKADLGNISAFMNQICWNTGNSYITYSLIKMFFGKMVAINHIPNIYLYDFSKQDNDIDFINTNCSHVFLILQDQIRIEKETYGFQLPYKQLEGFIKKINKPILVAGLGINCFQEMPADFHRLLNPDLVSLLHTISEKCALIGVRGFTTQEVLEKLGITNVQAIGCPSFYENGRERKIFKKEFSDDLKIILSNPQRYELSSKYPIILQAERPLIDAVAFNKRDFEDLTDDEFFLLQKKQYHVFSSVEEWKSYVSSFDFCMGYRVHGSILAINSGVSAVCFNTDARAKEMMSLLKIPYYPEYGNSLNIEEIYARCDYDRMNKTYPELYDRFMEFLHKNDFFPQKEESVEKKQPSLPLYADLPERVNTFLKSRKDALQKQYEEIKSELKNCSAQLADIRKELNIFSENNSVQMRTNLRIEIQHFLNRPSFLEYQRVRLLSHITFGKMKRHYVEKKKKYKQADF